MRFVPLALALAAFGCSADRAGQPAFRHDAAAPGPSLSLRAGATSRTALELEVIGHGIADVYGIALRMSYDPQVFRFEKVERGSVFDGLADVVVVAREARPGLLLVAVTRQGAQAGTTADDVELAKVDLRIESLAPSRVELVASRASALAADGTLRNLAVSGGDFLAH
jgi:hypothetical protein